MGGYVNFWMPEQFRQSLIQRHLFYVEQARTRLLTRFDDMEKEANEAEERWLERNGIYFDPDRDDPASFHERAHDVGIEFYQLLEDMRGRTQLSVIAGIFHEWDKQLRDWLLSEIRRWHQGDAVSLAIWNAKFLEIAKLLDSLGWNFRTSNYFEKFDACRVVVNVYKHGDGTSFKELRSNFPEYIRNPWSEIGNGQFGAEILGYKNLVVSDAQFQEFSDAVVEFWRNVPEETRDSDTLPAWLKSAFIKDGAPNKAS